MHGQVEAITDFAPVNPVQPFGCALVALEHLGTGRALAQGNAIGLEGFAGADQLQLAGGFDHQYFFDQGLCRDRLDHAGLGEGRRSR
ncbi:hypothetical protein D3C86_2000660 [compost metagenome]